MRPPPSACPGPPPTATGRTPGPGSETPFPGPSRAEELLPDSVRQPESVLALMGEPQPGVAMVTDPNRVKEIFLEAVEQPDEAARVAYLDRACGGDAGLRERVEALLRSHDPAGSFLGSPAVNPPDPNVLATQEVGSVATPDDENEADDPLMFLTPSTRPDSLGRLGHYEMLQVLGRGGFGI